MIKSHKFTLAGLAALMLLASTPVLADNMASIGITPATGVVTLSPQWGIGSGLAGFHHMSQDLGLGGQANNFYSIISADIPMGGNIAAFNLYVAASGFATAHEDIGSKLTPNSYSALTSADPDVGYGSVNMYFIHHKSTGDYFSVLVPGSSVSSSVTDLKPMDGPGGPATLGTSGYFGLTFASSNLGYGLNQFYYLRTHPVSGDTVFGTLDPGLLNTSADQFSLGTDGHVAVTFTDVDVGYGTDQMYYLRLDPITGYTILGRLNPALAGARHTEDIANLGSVFTTLTFTPTDLGFGVNQFYTTGSINTTWQSVSFAAIADRAVTDGSFTVNPTASSGLPIVLTVVSGSATVSSPVGGVFTVTPLAPGLITLQATQAGAINPTAYEYNMLMQSFMATGITISPNFNRDASADIVWENTVTGAHYIWLMTGTTHTGGADLGISNTNWRAASTADFNRDGHTDILWEHKVTGARYIWLMTDTVHTGGVDLGTFSTDWRAATAADFNNDSHTDILWENTVTGGRYIWLMTDTAHTGGVDLGIFSTNWRAANGADFNGDGHTDILWQNTVTGGRYIWLMTDTVHTGGVDLGIFSTNWDATN